jgi:activator of 2-hydroxyglutaryl-CoA dehydratase
MAQGLRVENAVTLSGGVAKNTGVVRALERSLGVRVKVPPEPQIVAALGAAICAREMADRTDTP